MSKQTNYNVIRKNSAVLKKAREIFGKIVIDAWMIDSQYPDESNAEVSGRLDNKKQYIKQSMARQRETTMEIHDIVLRFSSGKDVLFSAPEWALLTVVNTEAMKEM